MKVIARLLSIPLTLIAMLVLWLAVSPFTPHISYWGAGSLIGPQYIGPLLLIALVLVILAALGALASRSCYVPSVLAGIALVASVGLLGTQIHAAKEQGTDVDIPAAFTWTGVEKADEGPDHTVTYDSFNGDDLTMDIYSPETHSIRSGSSHPRKHPVMMYVHGGGWDQMTKRSQAFNMRQMAQRGYLVLSIDYTLSSWEQPTWKVAAGQVGCAMNWVNAHAADYGGDSERFFTYGESAGGQLVLNATADVAAHPIQLPFTDCSGTPAVPSAVYADSPALDVRHIYDSDDPYAGQGSRDTVEKYLGGTPKEYPDRADFVTSATHLTSDMPPIMIVRSDHDRLVPPASYDDFRQRAKDKGVELEEYVRPHADHASALSAHGVWNQHLLQAMTEFFQANDLEDDL